MTHVDPFAPASDPRHPANFRVVTHERQPTTEDWEVHLLLDAATDADGISREDALLRTDEYVELLADFGTAEERDAFELEHPQARVEAGAPTLGVLRQRQRDAAQESGETLDPGTEELPGVNQFDAPTIEPQAATVEDPKPQSPKRAVRAKAATPAEPAPEWEDDLAAALAALDEKK